MNGKNTQGCLILPVASFPDYLRDVYHCQAEQEQTAATNNNNDNNSLGEADRQ